MIRCVRVLAGFAQTIERFRFFPGTLEQIFLTNNSPGSIFIGRGLGSYLDHGLHRFALGFLLAAILGICSRSHCWRLSYFC